MPKIKLSRAMRKGPHRAGRNKPNMLATARKCECERDCHLGHEPDVQPVKTPFATLQACTYCRDNCLAIYNTPLTGAEYFRPKDQTLTTDGKPIPPTPCDHVAPRKGCSYCQQRLRMQEETLDRTTKLLLGGNVADYLEAALYAKLPPEDHESLADCPLISVCGIACKEVIDAARILYSSAYMHLGEDSSLAVDVRETALKLCQVIYCG